MHVSLGWKLKYISKHKGQIKSSGRKHTTGFMMLLVVCMGDCRWFLFFLLYFPKFQHWVCSAHHQKEKKTKNIFKSWRKNHIRKERRLSRPRLSDAFSPLSSRPHVSSRSLSSGRSRVFPAPTHPGKQLLSNSFFLLPEHTASPKW